MANTSSAKKAVRSQAKPPQPQRLKLLSLL